MTPLKKILYTSLLVLILAAISGCEKFLDEKPNKKLVVPVTLTDLQALMDNIAAISLNNPSLPELCADDYYNTLADWNSFDAYTRNAITWEKDLGTTTVNTWRTQYTAIYYANTVLEGLESLGRTAENAGRYDHIRGQALYYRAKTYLLLATLFCSAYDAASSDAELGIPVRLGTDFNVVSKRASVADTYKLIENDLRTAAGLLDHSQVHILRPDKTAAFGLLARVHLFMRNYSIAGLYADSCLQLNEKLLDYNTLRPEDNFPIKYTGNEEVIILNRIGIPVALSAPAGKVNEELFRSYEDNDLRKSIFFRRNSDNSYSFRGGYEGNGSFFGGQATDEVYLIRAEAFARAGNTALALADLNTLLEKRYRRGTFIPLTAASPEAALDLVLQERRKELLFRNLRWADIKRLNREGRDIVAVRKIGDQEYRLEPNDKRFNLQFPEDIIELTGMEQNP